MCSIVISRNEIGLKGSSAAEEETKTHKKSLNSSIHILGNHHTVGREDMVE